MNEFFVSTSPRGYLNHRQGLRPLTGYLATQPMVADLGCGFTDRNFYLQLNL